MKGKIIVLNVLFLLTFSWAAAQLAPDMVLLKDGSFIRGTVMEYIKGSRLRMKTMDGEVLTFEADQVKKIKSSSKPGKIPNQFELREKGFYNITTLGFLMRNTGYSVPVAPGLEMVNGYLFKTRFLAGVGFGVDIIDGELNLPLYADFRYNFREMKMSPFVSAKAGYGFAISRRTNELWGGPLPERRFNGGPLAGIEAGLRIYSGSRFAMVTSLEYRFQMKFSSYMDHFWNGSEYIYQEVLQRTLMNRFGLRLGILFH